MRRLGYGINSYHKTVSIYVDYAPWWIFWIDDVFTFVCDIIPRIPLPPIPMRLFDEDSIEFNDGKKWTTIKSWCGTLRDLFHLFIHDPISEYCWHKTDGRTIAVNYNKARKAFYDKDKIFWDEQEQSAEEMRGDPEADEDLVLLALKDVEKGEMIPRDN